MTSSTSFSPDECPTTAAAIVVAGGAARRMGGVDKLALAVGDRSLLDLVLAAARPRCRRLVVVGPRRRTVVDGVRFVREDPPGGGPVPAVAAGLDALDALDGHDAASPEAAAVVVVLAADLPLLTAGDVEHLIGVLTDPAVDAAAAADDQGRPNPLLAVYRVGALRARLAELGRVTSGARAARLLPAVVSTVDLGDVATINVNDAGDLEAARSAHSWREP